MARSAVVAGRLERHRSGGPGRQNRDVRPFGLLLCNNLTLLTAIGKGAAAMCPFGVRYLKTLLRLDVTLISRPPIWDQTGQLAPLGAATQLTEMALRGVSPAAADIEVLRQVQRLRVLNVEPAPHASPAQAANAMKQLLRWLPSVEVTCLEPDTECCAHDDDSSDDDEGADHDSADHGGSDDDDIDNGDDYSSDKAI
jgi:hypothetical protein